MAKTAARVLRIRHDPREGARIEAASRYVTSHHPESNAQIRGPVWSGPRPRRPHLVRECANCAKALVARATRVAEGIEKPAMTTAVTPGSPLAQALARLRRSDRRNLLAAVQASPRNRNRRRLERRSQAALRTAA